MPEKSATANVQPTGDAADDATAVQMQQTPVTEMTDEQKAADEAAKVAQQRAEDRRAYNEKLYQESIEGQELPPSVQEEQKTMAASRNKAGVTKTTVESKG
jgi:hypothetical protein